MIIKANGKEYKVGEKELTIKGKGVVNDLMNMDLMELLKLNTDQLRAVIRTAATTINMRYRNLEKHEDELGEVPALKSWRKNVDGGITTKGKQTRQQLLEEYSRAKHYYNLETGTVEKARKHKKKIMKAIFDSDKPPKWTKEQYDDFWDLYDIWHQKAGNSATRYKEVFQILIDEKTPKLNKDDPAAVYKYIKNKLTKSYEEKKLEEEDDDEFSTGAAFSALQDR